MTRPMLKAEQDRPANPVQGGGDAIDTLARMLWAHGVSDGVRALEGLASMAINHHHLCPGRTLADIARDPALFPVNDPDHALHADMHRVDTSDPAFAVALRVARRAMAGTGSDLVAGATRFHAINDHPDWAAGQVHVAMIGRLMFYPGPTDRIHSN